MERAGESKASSGSWSAPAWMVGGALWMGLVVAGMGVLVRYSLAPGAPGHPPDVWPVAATIARSPATYTLVLVVHPHCPCTRASLDELDGIMARCHGKLVSRVLFVQPEGFTEDWVETDLWRHAESIPGVVAMVDARGVLAGRFGALTSGQTVLYDPRGRLLFSGGITGARGHAGPNAGATAVVTSVEGAPPTTTRTPVYGCPLHDPPRPLGKQGQACPSS